MKVLFLGSGGYHPNERRQTTCIMVPEFGIVLDAGTGFFRVRDHIQTEKLFILLSHAHLDHSVGLTYLLDVLYEKLPQEATTVYGLGMHLEAVRNHLFNTQLFPVPPKFKTVELNLPPVPFMANGITVSYKENMHSGKSLGYRLQFPNGKTIVYITDATSTEADAEFVRGADLLIHECYFSDDNKDRAAKSGHTATSAVHRLAQIAGAKKLVLMHLNPLDTREDSTDQAHAETPFQGAIIASDGLEVEV